MNPTVKIIMIVTFCLVAVMALAAGKPSRFVTEDGVEIMGSMWMPEGAKAPAVILLHMLGHNRGDWNGFAEELLKDGYAVVSIDLRGHGESLHTTDGKTLNYKAFSDSDYQNMVKDVAPVLQFLRDDRRVDSNRIAIIGASIGANVALRVAASDPQVAAVVLISPGKSYHGVTTEPAMIEYGKRPSLIIASNEDAYAATSSQRLRDIAQGDSNLIMYKNAGHGTQIFDTEPDMGEQIVKWLGQNMP
jgi:pimeloyl-ACP methyl ester carboxylesterase